VIFAGYQKLQKNDAFWLCLVLLVIGICDLVWYRMYKVESAAINSYRAYLEVGKYAFWCVFDLCFANRNQLKIGSNKFICC
jgi:O-antigen ligase